MLKLCPECCLQVSDKAATCPHCGYPLDQTPVPVLQRPVPQKRRMHLPNGFGSITEVRTKNLRNPFYVTVPAGKTPEGRPIRKPLKPKSSLRHITRLIKHWWNITEILMTQKRSSAFRSYMISGIKNGKKLIPIRQRFAAIGAFGGIPRQSKIFQYAIFVSTIKRMRTSWNRGE